MTRRSRSPSTGARRTEGYRLNGEALWQRARAIGDESQRAIAERARVDGSILSRLLEGNRGPSLDTVIALAQAYACRVEDLIVRPDGTPLQIPAQAARTAAAVG